MATAATNNERIYNAHPKQSVFHRAVSAHDVTLFNGGRNSGKTTAGAIQAIMEAIEYQPGERGLITAPSYPMLVDATMPEFFEWLPRHYIRKFNKQEKKLWLTNDTEIAFRSTSDPDSARGPNRAWAWQDEPRNAPDRRAFDIIRAQLRPTCKMWLTTTPAGIFHWLYEIFIASPLRSSKVVHVRTSENPHAGESYEQDLRAQYAPLFAQQELDAEWISFEGLVYPEFSLQFSVTTQAAWKEGRATIWGVDDGYAKGDGPGHANYHPRVILVGQVTALGGLDIFAEYYSVGESDYQTSIEKVRRFPSIAMVDSSAAMFRGALLKAGIRTYPATHRVSEGVKNVRRLLYDANGERLLRIHPRCKQLIREMQSYRYNERVSVVHAGEPQPLKLDDHGPDALRYMAQYLAKRSR